MQKDPSQEARALIAPALAIFLSRVAEDKRCSVDDLSVELTTAAEDFGLECGRLLAERTLPPDERPTKPTTISDEVDGAIDGAIRTDHPGLMPPTVPRDFFDRADTVTPIHRKKQQSPKKRRPPT